MVFNLEGYSFDEESGNFRVSDVELTVYEFMICRFEIGNGIVSVVDSYGKITHVLSDDALGKLSHLRAQYN
ncbi:MAG: hypothetical protein ACM3UR_06165 [Bacteroidota bacterium]|jgi:hypothetical protein|nr:hypothetical protein [Ignavibacteria bacterium]HEX2964126.1 hypothetical protein [Ignavibacteriales bacterium]MCU7498521.1 hypothetical protein [Ignavibacteria bacterium]MCU7513529.1 hypothetical protein [Ignavibacteria bacterium]MCU7521908.1 hypothetical protein [Ignavibacteria bacterium]